MCVYARVYIAIYTHTRLGYKETNKSSRKAAATAAVLGRKTAHIYEDLEKFTNMLNLSLRNLYEL